MKTTLPPLWERFIRSIPKTDLHLHLDGSLRIPTLIELARRARVRLPSSTEAGLRRLVFKDQYRDLPDYLKGFAYTCAVLQDRENLERVACELAEDCLAEGVRYIEVRFAPQLHVHDGDSMKAVVRAVAKGMERARSVHNRSPAVRQGADLPFEFGLIVCAMRNFTEAMSPYYANLFRIMPRAPRREILALASLEMARTAVALRDQDGLPIAGFDLAGEESGFPASYHTAAYHYAHRHFLKKTVHAGEAYGPESIFQAITDCHTNRIGHGTFLYHADMIRDPDIRDHARYVEQLSEYIASQRITIEACVTSNLQTTPSLRWVADHPIRRMIAHDLSVSVCTDNRLVSNTTVSRELGLLIRHLKPSRRQFRNLVLAGFKGSFFRGAYSEKRAYVRRAIELYERCERDLLPPGE